MTAPRPPELTKCPACGSLYCGVVCRFYMLPRHELRANDYANAMTKRDQAERHIGSERHDFDAFGQPLNRRES